MNTPALHRSRAGALLAFAAHLLFASIVLAQSSAPAADPKKEEEEEMVVLHPFMVGSLGLTPGGFQNIAYARELLKYGMLPLPGELTAEGLFSEYDLPLSHQPATKLVEIRGAGMGAQVIAKPKVTHLAQIGFSSNLTPESFKRDPLFLTIVLDVSGSMQPYFSLVKESVHVLLGRLREGDAVSIVVFSESAWTVLEPMNLDAARWHEVQERVNSIVTLGGTNIEAGLETGFGLAQRPPAGFAGRSRVVLITDAMPNIGGTAPDEFMALATAASLKGVGLTTIGLNIQFDSDFVRKVSSVSGGNAYWFADAAQMRKTLEEDFDFMVTEVAFDLEMRVKPSAGFSISQVYGLPGDAYARTPDGGIVMDVPTLFLSRAKGAIFLTLEARSTRAHTSGTLGTVALSYTIYGKGDVVQDAFVIRDGKPAAAGTGLKRGLALISEYEALKAAGEAFYQDNRIKEARRLVQATISQFGEAHDGELAKELELLAGVERVLAASELNPRIDEKLYESDPDSSPLIGVWTARKEKGDNQTRSRWVFLPNGKIATIQEHGKRFSVSVSDWSRDGVGEDEDDRFGFGVDRKGLYLARDDEKIRLTRVVYRR